MIFNRIVGGSGGDDITSKLIDRTLTSLSTSKLTTVGDYAFCGCSLLQNIDLPNCSSVGSNAFQGCVALTEAHFSTCSAIGDYAFYNCTNFTSLYLLSSSVVTLGGTQVFTSTPTNKSFYVPSALLSDYQVATNWSAYSTKFVGV